MDSLKKTLLSRSRVVLFCLVAACSNASELTAQLNKPQVEEPLTQWSGSTLGMESFGSAPKNLYVWEIRSGLAAERAGLKPYDRLIRIGKVDLLKQSKADLQNYLDQLAPNSKLKIVVGRREKINGEVSENEKRLEFDLVTDSKPLADGSVAADMICQNQVVIDSLKARGSLELLDQFKENLLAKIKLAQNPSTAYEIINEHLDRLDVSHCAIIPRWNYDRKAKRMSGKIGLSLKRFRRDGENKYFVVDMEPGGPAFNSPIQIGDQVISVNGVGLEKSGRLTLAGMEQRYQFFMLAVTKGETIRLAFRQKLDSEVIVADITTNNDLTPVSATRFSVKVLSHQGKQIGYCRLWDLMSMGINKCLQEALKEKFVDCDAIIIDLRGRGGKTKVLTRVQETISKSGLPVVGIIDKHTRSAKEVLAYRLKHDENVVMVGQVTCGATTWSKTTKLPSGTGLRYPVISAEKMSSYTNGIVLEGRGVKPDIPVNFELPFSNGEDPLLNTAKDQAVKMIQ